MALIKESTLQRIRTKVGPKFDEGMCEIWRSGAPIATPGGGATKPTQTRVTNQDTGTVAFPCRIMYLGFNQRREKVIAAKQQEVADYLVALPVFTEVQLRDVIVYTGKMWLPETAYIEGVHTGPIPSNGFRYRSVLGGTTGGAEPVWSLMLNQNVSDGNLTWRNDGPLPRLEVVEVIEPKTFEITRQVICNVIKPN